ncbi:LppP/LprE family lipoprotein [Actinomyces bowdenii]|uniref:LppP/LprE family lipoprotein n=1 Tax=Actinomyces bowdenii TaxID=131109 RepID=UPI001ABC3242|nr:LppP/LprE family lipoprotein [Actinomyces bowdenii]MBO3725679.1 LppP/LprE family lipoprotein [Actinomyces bowdenii]
MTHHLTTRASAAVALALSLMLTGCQDTASTGGSDPTGAESPSSTSLTREEDGSGGLTEPGSQTDLSDPAAQTDPATPTPQASPACSGMSGEEALQTWGGQVEAVKADPMWQWDLEAADTSTYDECAALSWVVLGIHGPTGSSPYQIMLFHHGQYIGVTSDQAIGFAPQVVRIDDGSIEVTYTWTREGESTADASGRSVSVFTWDEASSSVVHSGEWPPAVQ